jgi:FtsP/CotA-like multicopper oxidase with cupredoxin domain
MLNPDGSIPDPGHMAQMTGRIGDLVTVSGLFNPTLTLAKGGLLRLRLLNASPSRFFRLALENHLLHLIATDGGAIATPVELETLTLAPGERAEVLVQGNQSPGQYRLLNYPFNPAQGMIHGIGHDSGNHQQDYSETLATLVYDGETAALPVPDQLIPIAPLPQPETVREFNLSHGMMGLNDHAGMHQGMVFLINGKSFEHNRVDTTVQLNTVEDWDITNTGTMAHPFHLHINKFQVISRNGEPEPYLAWKDVVSVAPGERVRIRVAFRDYPGKTVYHCHVLDHEDQGMMGILEMLPG